MTFVGEGGLTIPVTPGSAPEGISHKFINTNVSPSTNNYICKYMLAIVLSCYRLGHQMPATSVVLNSPIPATSFGGSAQRRLAKSDKRMGRPVSSIGS